MLRRFCENLKTYCLLIFLLAIAVGVGSYMGGVIRWMFINPGAITHSAMVIMAISSIGMGMLSFMLIFGLFGDKIMVFIKRLDVTAQKIQKWLSKYIFRRKENGEKIKLSNKILLWLEKLDMKFCEKTKQN